MCDCGCTNRTTIKPAKTMDGVDTVVSAYEPPIIFCACHCHDVWRMVNRGNR